MKAAILVCAMAAVAMAAPRYKRATTLDSKLSEHARAAEQAWTTAAAEPDPRRQLALWESAAAAFAEVDGDPVDASVKREAARAAVIAWKNAIAVDVRVADPAAKPEKQLPARELKLFAAIDRYATYVDASDAELPDLLFIKAKILVRFDQTEAALPIYRAILDHHRQHEVAGYSASLLLDAYNRLQQFDKLVALADELAKDDRFMRDHDDLAIVVRKIRIQARRRALEQLEAAAKTSGDLEQYTAVGTGFLELFNANPESPDGDELLYNAAVSFESGKSIGRAIEIFGLLQRQYPRGRLAMRALARLARLYGTIAFYDKAAEKLEEYAKRYAGEKDAHDAMSDAVYFRKAIGDRVKAIDDTRYFVKTFGAKQPREAADAMWSLTALYEAEPDHVVAHLLEYLRTYGAKGGAERVAIAYAMVGQVLWKQSCPVPLVDGLCVKANDRAARTCGAGTMRTLAAIARDERKAKEAMASFTSAIKEYERRPTDDAGARYHYAQARLAMADAELEPYFTIAVPRGLEFDPATQLASEKRFAEWIEQKQKAGGNAMRKYETVLAIKDAATSITAAERLGIIAQSFASALATGETPRGTARVQRYCDRLNDVAAPLETRALQAFAVCLAKSTELGWFSDASAQCERELIRTRPEEFPRATELRSRPDLVAPVIDLEPASR